MIKNILLGAVTAVAGLSAMGQNEHMHVFYGDNGMYTVKGADILSLTHEDGTVSSGFRNLVIRTMDGESKTIALSAVDSVQVRMTGLPEIHVTLQDDPTATELWGAKDLVHPATLYMNGNGMYDDLDEQTVEFRGRGNSTWGMNKKPYRFKMAKKKSVCGLAKARTFALIANYIDCSLMRNAVALWTAGYLGMPYSNHCVPVKVYLNGIYKGAYMLTEKIGIGGGSVDIDECKGMLFEIDSNYDEDFRFAFDVNTYTALQPAGSPLNNRSVLPVMVKDPDITEVAGILGIPANEYFETWKADFVEMAKTVMATSGSVSLKDCLDLESVANFFIVNSLANNHEMQHPKSFYIYKDSIGGVYKFGPVWDFDWAFTFDGYEGAPANKVLVSTNGDCAGYTFITALFRNQEFRNLYKQKWDEFVANGYPELQKYMEEYASLIEPSAIENGQIWPADHSVDWRRSESSLEFRKNFKALKEWIQKRVDYCSSHVNFGIYQ